MTDYGVSDRPWARSVGIYRVLDDHLNIDGEDPRKYSRLRCHTDEAWVVYRDRTTAVTQRQYLNAGTIDGERPCWSNSLAAIYTPEQAAAIILSLEDAPRLVNHETVKLLRLF